MLAAVAALGAGQARAAAISWGAVTNDTGQASDVITTGTLLDAGYYGPAYWLPSTTAVNGVTFNNLVYSGGSVSDGADLSMTPMGANGTGPGAPLTGWDANYAAMINRGAFVTPGASPPALTISGLTVGEQYTVQIWMPNWNFAWPDAFSDGVNQSGTVNSAGQSAIPQYGIGVVADPQYVTGTFTADASTQLIYAIATSPPGAQQAGFSAVQVRSDEAPPAPEPASLALLAPAVAAALRMRRRISVA